MENESKKLSFSGLSDVYNETINKQEPTLVFELKDGNGRFLFLMFFDDEDKKTKDYLYIFMRSTMQMLSLKMCGNHSLGIFDVYIKPYMEQLFKKELGLTTKNPNNPFVFEDFFFRLDSRIPKTLPLQNKINVLRNSWNKIKNHLPNDLIDEANKTNLIGTIQLPKGKKPREKTLQKLYFFATVNTNDITELIEKLRKLNMTLGWTDNSNYQKQTVSDLITQLKSK